MTEQTSPDDQTGTASGESTMPRGASDGVLHGFLQSRWDDRKIMMVVAGAVVLFVGVCFLLGSGLVL